MTKLPLDNPAQVDALLAGSQPHDLLDGLVISSPLARARFGQIALATAEQPLMLSALGGLMDITDAPARGVRMMLQAQLGDYTAVLQQNPQPLGHTPLELEDATHAHAACAVAYTQTGNFDQAVCHLSVAIALGLAVQLEQRVSVLEIERERMMSLRGTPRPENLASLLVRPMPERRKAWGRRTWAESLMALGDYQGALRALGHQSVDQAPDRALRAFLHELLSLPATEELPGSNLAAYGLLAQSLNAPEETDWAAVRRIEGQPQATYGALLEALALTGSRGGEHYVARLLGHAAPSRPDQAALFALLWLDALANGQPHPAAIEVHELLRGTSDRLRTTRHVLAFAQRFLPELTVLLSMNEEFQALDISVVDVPLLVGPELVWRGKAHRLPGRAGRLLVQLAAGVPEDDPKREERKRLNTRLSEIGAPRYVNMGRIVLQAGQLASRFRIAGELEVSRAWQQTARRAAAMCGMEMADVLAMPL